MMWPILCKVQYETLREVFKSKDIWIQLGVSFVANWIIGPIILNVLAWITLPDLPGYRRGVILLSPARCIAMVLIWNTLAKGSADYCAVLVAVNSLLQIILYSPLAYFYLNTVSSWIEPTSNTTSITNSVVISWMAVLKSVVIYLGIPFVFALITRFGLLKLRDKTWLTSKFLPWFGLVSLLGLIYTILVMFSMQGHRVISNIGQVFRIMVPLILYFSIMFFATCIWCTLQICCYTIIHCKLEQL